MKTVTKKITGFFFILLGLAPLLFVLFISLKKEQIHHRMEEEMKHRDLTTIILSEKEVVWMDKNEIWINNSMFDIHSKQLENGFYTFTGLYDQEETKLVQIERNAAGENKEQNKLLAELFEDFPVLYSQANDIHNPLLQYLVFRYYNSENPVNPSREIPTPPPQA